MNYGILITGMMGIVIAIEGMSNFLLMVTDDEVHISITTLSNHHKPLTSRAATHYSP
jgi:hypothetical protein